MKEMSADENELAHFSDSELSSEESLCSDQETKCDLEKIVQDPSTDSLTPVVTSASQHSASESTDNAILHVSTTFTDFGRRYLDDRLTRALSDTMRLKHPTLIQSKAIPFILLGKDVLARARTGSGKTLAYAVPMLQRCLTAAQNGVPPPPLSGCVFVPTRELAAQVVATRASVLSFRIVVRFSLLIPILFSLLWIAPFAGGLSSHYTVRILSFLRFGSSHCQRNVTTYALRASHHSCYYAQSFSTVYYDETIRDILPAGTGGRILARQDA